MSTDVERDEAFDHWVEEVNDSGDVKRRLDRLAAEQ
jgi:hypothetical protein